MANRYPSRQPEARRAEWYRNHEANLERMRRYRASHRDQLRGSQRRYFLWSRYHLTEDAFTAMLEDQTNGCAICHTDVPGGSGTWHVDHDHQCCPGRKSCGQCVRGLICYGCNRNVIPVLENRSLVLAGLAYLRKGCHAKAA